MKIVAYVLLLFTALHLSAQDSLVKWTQSYSKPIAWFDVWSVDGMGNLIKTNRHVIEKFDSSGNVLFSQSIRSLGGFSEISPVNAMKLMTFSADQQTVCTFDNTLTLSENCLDLTEFGIQSAIHASASAQPDRIWVLDQLNYHLMALNTSTRKYMEVSNLTGLLNLEQVDELREYGNELYLLDKSKGLYRFDFFGSLVSYFPEEGCQAFAVDGKNLFLLKKSDILIIDLETEESQMLKLPMKQISDFSAHGSVFFFRTVDKIFRYRLSLP